MPYADFSRGRQAADGRDDTDEPTRGRLVWSGNPPNAGPHFVDRIESDWRSRAEQEVLDQKYLNGTGNLAAKPGASNHESGQANRLQEYLGRLRLAQEEHREVRLPEPARGTLALLVNGK